MFTNDNMTHLSVLWLGTINKMLETSEILVDNPLIVDILLKGSCCKLN